MTLVLGAWIALFQHDLKGLLAYSTISHLGLITLLFGLDTPLAVVAGVFHILNHATFKASLFMAAGIIDHETGTPRHAPAERAVEGDADHRRARDRRRAPRWPACRCSTASCPRRCSSPRRWSIDAHGFDRVRWCRRSATLAARLRVAYSLRFIHDVFFNGEPVDLPRTPHEPPRWMRVPVELLVAVCLAVGVLPALTIGPLLAPRRAARWRAAARVQPRALARLQPAAADERASRWSAGRRSTSACSAAFHLHSVTRLPVGGKRCSTR